MRRRVHFTLALGFALSATRGLAQGEPPPENPHWRADACDACHGETVGEAVALSETEAICRECHDPVEGAIHIHPMDSDLGDLGARMRASAVPLDGGAVTCQSCHDTLLQCRVEGDVRYENHAFLRGPAGGDLVGSCHLCHDSEAYEPFDPHAQVADDGSLVRDQCLICHEDVPDPSAPRGAAPALLRSTVERLCIGCHPVGIHPRGYDHAVAASPEMVQRIVSLDLGEALVGMTPRQVERFLATRQVEPLALPLGPGQEIRCTTCHNAHEVDVFPASDPRARGAERSPSQHDRLRLEGDALCQTCHER